MGRAAFWAIVWLMNQTLRSLFLIVFLWACYAGAAYAQTIDTAKIAGLIPHKALYKIDMIGKKSSAQVLNVSGKMMYEWRSDCFAWVSDHNLDVVYDYADTSAVRIQSNFSTYETLDGLEMNFSTRKKRNGVPFEDLRGYANLKDKEVEFSIPEGLTQDLPEDTLFPMSHTLQVLKRMKAGERFFASTIFDGSDKRGPIFVNTFMGSAKQPPSELFENTDLDQALLKTPARDIRLSFFPSGSDSPALPEYEMSVVLHKNGVISDMVIEYEDFTVSQTLIGLEEQDNTCTEELKTAE